jgi:hypothetical protein
LRERGEEEDGTASGADLVKPGGSGKADEEEEEDASWSSTAQRRARPLPFSIAGGRCCC